PQRWRITPELVGDHYPWLLAGRLERAPQERFGRKLVTSLLNQDVQHHAVLVDRTPQPVALAFDLELHVVQVPFVAPTWASPPHLEGLSASEFGTPFADRLITHSHATLGHEFFDVTQAQGEAKSTARPRER